MPGTIQVTVMDFKGPLSSSDTSQICVKVSMGKRECQTSETMDFSFPLTTLRDNLVVALKDSEGNEVSCTAISVRTVVEKGIWDDIFYLEGGAQVHLQLQFVLTEAELDKIRMMRQSALKKKRGEPHRSSVQSSETTPAGNHVAPDLGLNNRLPVNEKANQADQASNQLSENSNSMAENVENASEGWKQPASSDTGKGEATTSYSQQLTSVNLTKVRGIGSEAYIIHKKSKSVIVPKKKTAPAALEEDMVDNTLKNGLSQKSSNNVKRMISAFEVGVAQDTSPFTKPPPTNLQSSKIGREGYLKDEISAKSNSNNSGLAESISGGEIDPLSEINTEKGNIPKDMEGTSIVRANATALRRILNENYDGHGYDNFISNEKLSSQDRINENGRTIYLKTLNEDVQRTSNNITKSVGSSDDKYSGSSCTQVFAEAGRRFCLTTGDKRVMDLVNSCNIEAKGNQGELKENIRHDGSGDENGENTIHVAGRSSTEIAEENIGMSEGPIRQVVKIAIMIGFGTLVLLTRQRQSRYMYSLLMK